MEHPEPMESRLEVEGRAMAPAHITRSTTMNLKSAAVVATLFVVSAANAGEGEAMPKPNPLIAKLAGTWKGTGTATMGGKPSQMSWTLTCTTKAGGYAAQCQFEAKGLPNLPLY
jgi:hypothetical protein